MADVENEPHHKEEAGENSEEKRPYKLFSLYLLSTVPISLSMIMGL